MDLLFSALVAGFLMVIGVIGTFIVARLFFNVRTALRVAIVFVISGAGGALGIALVLAFFIGWPGPLFVEDWVVWGYFSILGLGGLMISAVAVWIFLSWQRSNTSLQGTRDEAARP